MIAGLGKLIIQRRKDLGLTLQDLARIVGVPAANLSQLEHSASRWRSRLIPALADALQVSQLELALAAGIIDDLPPFPSPESTNIEGDLLYPNHQQLETSPPPLRERLRDLVEELSPAEIEFLLAVSETFPHHETTEDNSTSRSSMNGAGAMKLVGAEL
jgi:transcriptional regulator with XRE-family HTH domain